MKPLNNLLFLKKDMEKNGWVIESFRFNYKDHNYIVLVILYQDNEPKPQYALLQLDFLDANDFDNHLIIPANSAGLMTDAKTLRLFFGIEYAENLGDILRQFANQLGEFIPRAVNVQKPTEERKAIVHTLSKKDTENPNKVFCFAVKRNSVVINKSAGVSKQQKRSPYNDNKTRLLRPSLYEKLGKDDTLSFCYSDDPTKDYSDEIIVDSWNKRKNVL